jgi:hypothetical protein
LKPKLRIENSLFDSGLWRPWLDENSDGAPLSVRERILACADDVARVRGRADDPQV